MEDVELLIREAHQRGLKIIFDIALNHTASNVSTMLPDTGMLPTNSFLARMVPSVEARTKEPERRQAGLVFLEPWEAG